MLHLCISHNLVTPRGLLVTAGSGLAAVRPSEFSVVVVLLAGPTYCRYRSGRPSRVNDIALVSQDHCFGTMVQYCFMTRVSNRIWQPFCISNLPLYRTIFKFPRCLVYPEFTVIHFPKTSFGFLFGTLTAVLFTF